MGYTVSWVTRSASSSYRCSRVTGDLKRGGGLPRTMETHPRTSRQCSTTQYSRAVQRLNCLTSKRRRRCWRLCDMMKCLYCTVLYCTVLYCTVLYSTALYCSVLCCTLPYFTLQIDVTI